MKRSLLTRTNMDDYLINYIGIDIRDVKQMDQDVKLDLIKDDYDSFVEYIYSALDYIEEEDYEEFE